MRWQYVMEVNEELQELGLRFDRNFEYLDDCNNDEYSLGIKLTLDDICLKILIPEAYPDKKPKIEVLTMGAAFDSRMRKYLIQSINQFLGTAHKKNMLLHLSEEWSEILEGSKFSLEEAEDSNKFKMEKKKHRKAKFAPVFKTEQDNTENDKDGLLADDKTNGNNKTNTRAHRERKKKRSGKNNLELKKTDGKKPAMRTAKDVIQRFKWDKALAEEKFIVGYEDRFDGIIEVPVFDLNWEDDISSTGPKDKLAIPEHRIAYFKWNSEKIWEKQSRTDKVFGSTGSDIDIVQLIARSKEISNKSVLAEDVSKTQAGKLDVVPGFQYDNNSNSAESTCKKESVQSQMINENSAGSELSRDVRFVLDKILNELMSKTECANANDVLSVNNMDKMISTDVQKQTYENSLDSCQYLTRQEEDNSLITPYSDLESKSEQHVLVEKVAELSLCQSAGDDHDLEEMLACIFLGLEDDNRDQLEIPLTKDGNRKTEFDKEYVKVQDGNADGRQHGGHEKKRPMSSSKNQNDGQTNKRRRHYERRDSSRSKDKDDRKDRERKFANSTPSSSSVAFKPSKYFIGLQLPSNVQGNIREFQERYCNAEECIIEKYSFICLGEYHLRSEKEVDSVKNALQILSEQWHPFPVTICTEGYDENLVYANVRKNQSIESFGWKLENMLKSQDIRNELAYTPYVKIADLLHSRDWYEQKYDFGHGQITQVFLYEQSRKECISSYDFKNQHSGKSRYQGSKRNDYSGNPPHRPSFELERGTNEWMTAISKKLSAILRHNAVKGLEVDSEGFISVFTLLEHRMFKSKGVMLDDIKCIVKENAKKRFALAELESGDLKIRANQGHTVEVDDLELRRIVNAKDYPVVVHGTYLKSWNSIKKSGLCRMKSLLLKGNWKTKSHFTVKYLHSDYCDMVVEKEKDLNIRNHIHMTTSEPASEKKVISGMRSSCNLFIYIDLEKAMEDGIMFQESANGVILSEGNPHGIIEPKYFKEVYKRESGNRVLLMADGDKKGNLEKEV